MGNRGGSGVDGVSSSGAGGVWRGDAGDRGGSGVEESSVTTGADTMLLARAAAI